MPRVDLSKENKKYESLICNTIKLQVLLTRDVERNTTLRCSNQRDMERILMGRYFTITYMEALENLKKNTLEFSKNKQIIEEVNNLYNRFKESDIKNLKFGENQGNKFTPLEVELNNYITLYSFFMNAEFVSISEAAEILGITVYAIKQACQQERILNTKKIGKTWMVHLPECRKYWNLKEVEREGYLFKGLVY